MSRNTTRYLVFSFMMFLEILHHNLSWVKEENFNKMIFEIKEIQLTYISYIF